MQVHMSDCSKKSHFKDISEQYTHADILHKILHRAC